MLTPALVVVIDFGNILYWLAIIVGSMFAIGAVLSMVTGLCSKETWARPAPTPSFTPAPWELWFWRGVVCFLVLLVGVPVVVAMVTQ